LVRSVRLDLASPSIPVRFAGRAARAGSKQIRQGIIDIVELRKAYNV
jgi:hypothetical protein